VSSIAVRHRPWATWRPSEPYTVGLEEEVVLVAAGTGAPVSAAPEVIASLTPALRAQVGAETHAAALELSTGPHQSVRAAITELRELRRALAEALAPFGLRAAAAGTHPTASRSEIEVSPGERYQEILRAMRVLAQREPTFALHVHVGVADAEDAIRLHDRLRGHLPLLLALSSNSPFWLGRDTGMASARTPLFGTFPRTGIPRGFASFEQWVHAVDGLVGCGAIPEPTHLWWDVRPQPRFGTVEVRIMDAQTCIEDVAALAALVQAIARLELESEWISPELLAAPELLEENRFLAARDGMAGRLIHPERGRLVPAGELLAGLRHAIVPHARALGSRAELGRLDELAVRTGADRQRAAAADGGMPGVLAHLIDMFV
jgi:carboxylate-amine ligase